ncbi:hypothetical protein ISO18_18165 [Burkholderia pseudomultivorans]|uniref:hypothetical protein n=2 Tax=Burkholderia pseudomultivorans TaxID=1207504 RepID=UPI001186C715|nr:hypothetical protein [Burkholderia pseudomultivorans]MBF5011533.1 hypothetical protein [Burkholderia pseudomultivorans]
MSGSSCRTLLRSFDLAALFYSDRRSRMADGIEEGTVSTFREIRVQALQQALIDEARGFRINNEVAESVIARLDTATLAARISIVNRREPSAERNESPNRPGCKGDLSNS